MAARPAGAARTSNNGARNRRASAAATEEGEDETRWRRILITDVTIFDGSGREPFAGEVLVQGNRIVQGGGRRLPQRHGGGTG